MMIAHRFDSCVGLSREAGLGVLGLKRRGAALVIFLLPPEQIVLETLNILATSAPSFPSLRSRTA